MDVPDVFGDVELRDPQTVAVVLIFKFLVKMDFQFGTGHWRKLTNVDANHVSIELTLHAKDCCLALSDGVFKFLDGFFPFLNLGLKVLLGPITKCKLTSQLVND